MVTWWPMVKRSVSAKAPQWGTSDFSNWGKLSAEDSRALFQNTKGLACDSYVGTYQRLQQHPHLPLML